MIKTLSKSLLAFGVGLAMLPGCPLLDVQADAQEVCLSYPNLTVPAVGGGETSVNQSFTFDDLSQIHDLTKLDANLELLRAEIHATSGIDDFSFINTAKITITSGDLDPLTMYDCEGACDTSTADLKLPAMKIDNAIDYLRNDSIKVDVAFDGELPAKQWTMDVDVCFKASASYTFSP